MCDYDTGECLCPQQVPDPLVSAPGGLRGDTKSENETGIVCGDNITVPQDQDRILETKLSEYYIPNISLLHNDTELESSDGYFGDWFMNMSLAEKCAFFVTLTATAIGFFFMGMYIHNKYKTKRRAQQKDKMVATVLVDLRMHDPRLRWSRAARQTVIDETPKKTSHRQRLGQRWRRAWSLDSRRTRGRLRDHGRMMSESFESMEDTYSRTVSENHTSVNESGSESVSERGSESGELVEVRRDGPLQRGEYGVRGLRSLPPVLD